MTTNRFDRISIDPAVCHGSPVVRGTRIPVHQILDFLANGDSIEGILEAYPGLTRDDVLACLAYAAEMTRERSVVIDIAS